MNRIYRSIWNERTGTFVAAPENAKSHGRKSSSGSSTVTAGARFVKKGLAVSISLTLALSSNLYAGPTGGVVSAGSASITAGAGKTTINQASQNAAINWQSFSIGQKEAVLFVQPNSSSVALNRVLGSDPSNILGSLSANGKVFLVNPNGILFGQGAQVNVGGLVASTLNIGDSDFMAGRYNFAGAGKGTILNQGTINADGGYVALLGANVSNDGVISARLGTAALAAGNVMTLDVAGDGLLNVALNQGLANALVRNGGLIRADGGLVLLTAQAAGNLLQSVVNNTGVIQAQTIDTRNGSIRLLGDTQSGSVNLSGTLDASGTGAGQTGGSVTATGQHVGLFGGQINTSGDAGGGTVLIGGGYQGKNPAVQNASATYMSADSSISADAITNGSGGTAVLWSNDSTRAYGSISARGGAQGGAGGLIETSGHWLDVDGISINASAPNGTRGTWLLDPADVTLTAGTTNGTIAGGVFTPNPGAATATVDIATIVGDAATGLTGGTDITINTANNGLGNGDITVAAVITWTRVGAAPNTTLTLNAVRDVNINAAINPTQGNLVVCCGRDINVNADITMVRGSMLLSAGRNVNQLAAITSTDGNVAMCAGGDINVTAAMSTTRGTVIADRSLANLGVQQGLTFKAGNAATGPGVAGGGGAVVIAPPGGTVTIVQSAVVGEEVPVRVIYNPLSYGAPVIDYSLSLPNANPLTVQRLVFPEVTNQTIGGSTTAAFTGLLKADAANVRPGGVQLDVIGTGTFDSTATLGATPVTFTGFTLAGANVANFALPATCCAPPGGPVVGSGRTSGTIVAAVTTTTTTAATTTTTAATTTTTAATTTTTAAPTTTTAATTTTTAATTTTTAATTTTTAATTTTTAAPTTTTAAPTTTTAAPTTTTAAVTTTTAATTTTTAATTTTTLPATTTTTASPTTTTTVAATTTTTLPPIVLPIVPPLVPPATLQYQPGLPVTVVGTGVLMPPIQMLPPVAPPPLIPPPEAPPVIVPPPPPPVYVPPARPRKPERN